MLKHTVGQALMQITIIMIFVFAGDKFLFSTIRSRQNQFDKNIVVNGFEVYGYDYKARGEYSIHLTYVFNTFVMLTICNFINARILDDSLNVFREITNSTYFIVIIFVILIM